MVKIVGGVIVQETKGKTDDNASTSGSSSWYSSASAPFHDLRNKLGDRGLILLLLGIVFLFVLTGFSLRFLVMGAILYCIYLYTRPSSGDSSFRNPLATLWQSRPGSSSGGARLTSVKTIKDLPVSAPSA